MDDKRFNEVYLPRYRPVIEALARKVGRRNHELVEDLVQTGLIALWKLDPERAHKNEDAWIRTLLYNKMISVYRREKRRTNESLEVMLDRGAQVAEGESGEAMVIVPRGGRRRRPQTTDYDGAEGEE